MTYIFLSILFLKKKIVFHCLNKVQTAEANDLIASKCNYVLFIYICAGVYKAKYHSYRKRERCYEIHREMKLLSLLFLRLLYFRAHVKGLLFRTGTLNFDRYSVYKRDRYRFARDTHLQRDSVSRWQMDFIVRGYFIYYL